MKKPSEKYLARARALAEAIDVAAKVRAGKDRRITRFEQSLKKDALEPAPAFAKIKSLKYLESDFFTYWNESHDPVVAKFWREIAKPRLPFRHRDLAREALARGRITNSVDYEALTDALGNDSLSEAERRKLARLLAAYEER